jgi:hypothetical protein
MFVTEILHEGTPEVFLQYKLESHHMTYTALVRLKTQPEMALKQLPVQCQVALN